MQAQVQQLLAGLTEISPAPAASTQQPAFDQNSIAGPLWQHASSQQASAAQAGDGGTGGDHVAIGLPQLLQEPEAAPDVHRSSAPVAAPSLQPAPAAPPGDTASRVEAQLPPPVAGVPSPGSCAAQSSSVLSQQNAAPPFQLPPPELPAPAHHMEVPRSGTAARVSCRSSSRGVAARPAELSLSKETPSIDVGGPSRLPAPQQAAEAPAAKTSDIDASSVDIVGSVAPVSAAELALRCTPGMTSCADTASVDIVGPGVSRNLPHAADGAPAQADMAQIASIANISAASRDAAAAVKTVPPPNAHGRRKLSNDMQQGPRAAKSEARQLLRAACACKRPYITDQGAPGKRLKLQRALRELDIDPSSSLTLSGSEWLPAQPAKTRQQARASQSLWELRGRKIPKPGTAFNASGSKGHPCPELQEASMPPPGVAPAAHEGHAQARSASPCAQETAQIVSEHAVEEGRPEQQHSARVHQATEAVSFQSIAGSAKRAHQLPPSQREPQKGNRELNSLLTAALATPGHRASSAPLYLHSTGRTRAQSVHKPSTPGLPLHKKKTASAAELAKLLEAAAAVSPKDAKSAPPLLQAAGRTRVQSTGKQCTSHKPLSLKKDRPNRELARLLSAAAEVPPKDVSSAPLYLGPTRQAKAKSASKPVLQKITPSAGQAQAEVPLKPKPMRGFRELAALYEDLSEPGSSQHTRRQAVKPQQAERACQISVTASQRTAAAGQGTLQERRSLGSRKRQWAASGQGGGQLGRRATRMQSRRAGQLAALQGQCLALRTRGQNPSNCKRISMGSSEGQVLSSSKPHVKQTARKHLASKSATAGQIGLQNWQVKSARKQLRLRVPLQASPLRMTALKASRGSARNARITAVNAQTSAAPHSKEQKSAAGSTPHHAVPKRKGLALRGAAGLVHRSAARTLAQTPHKQFPAAEVLSSVASQAAGDRQQPSEAAVRRSKRAAAGGRYRQVLKQVRNPLGAARAELKQSRAVQGELLRRMALCRPKQAEQPLSAAPMQGATPLDRDSSQRPRREASVGVQRLVDACKRPWNALGASAGKQPHQRVEGTLPCKRTRSERQPDLAGPHRRGVAGASMAGGEPKEAAEHSKASMPSMEQRSGVASVHAPGLSAGSIMQQGWNLSAPQQFHVVSPMRSQQDLIAPEVRDPVPLQVRPGATAFRHAAYIVSGGGSVAPHNAAACKVRPLLQEHLGAVKRARSQQAAHNSMRERLMHKASAHWRQRMPKHIRQTTGTAQGTHVPAHEHSLPAGNRPHSKKAGQPSRSSQAEAFNAGPKAARAPADAISPQSKASQPCTCKN